MAGPDPLAAFNQSVANLSSGQYTPTTSGTTASSGLSPDQQVWHVYLGSKTGMTKDNSLGRFFEPGGKVEKTLPNVVTTDIAMGQFYGWSDAKRKKWGETLQAAGVIAPGDFSWDSLEGWWQKAVTAAGNIKTLGGQNITPEQWVQTRATGTTVGGTAQGGPDVRPRTDVTIPWEDPAALRDMIRGGVSKMLGRAPHDDELDDMVHVANQYAASAGNKTVVSTPTTDAKGNPVTTYRTTNGGPTDEGRAEAISNSIKAKPEYASYQAATTYMNALLSAISTPVDIPSVSG